MFSPLLVKEGWREATGWLTSYCCNEAADCPVSVLMFGLSRIPPSASLYNRLPEFAGTPTSTEPVSDLMLGVLRMPPCASSYIKLPELAGTPTWIPSLELMLGAPRMPPCASSYIKLPELAGAPTPTPAAPAVLQQRPASAKLARAIRYPRAVVDFIAVLLCCELSRATLPSIVGASFSMISDRKAGCLFVTGS